MSSPLPRSSRGAGHQARRWADAGLAELTGFAGRPGLGPPSGLIDSLDALCERIGRASAVLGRPVPVDGPAVLAERAAALGLRRRGQVSCGGATHLVRAVDGWCAVSLARPDDVELLPAWLGAPVTGDPWAEVHDRCRKLRVDEVVSRGVLLGLPVAALPSPGRPGVDGAHVEAHRPPPRAIGPRRPVGRDHRARPVTVVDLSSMWAGPLCGAILSAAGAEVTKVEFRGRPDGARLGSQAFFERLNGSKRHLELDVSSNDGVRRLIAMLRSADVVIEASRPRALAQIGIDPERLLADADGPSVWVSITGHGRTGEAAQRVAFGDDAAVAGGLVAWSGDQPTFCADAIADPLSGLTAAADALDGLRHDHSTLLDIAMAGVAAGFAAPVPPSDGGAPR